VRIVKPEPHAEILYLHYEPGIGLRYYLGGEFFRDLDFWSEPVQRHVPASATFPELLRRLGHPTVYVSYADGLRYAGHVDHREWEKYRTEIEALEGAPWVERVVRYGPARLFVTAAPPG